MKQQAIHFVGLDVHQSTVVACVRDESGKVVMKGTVPTEEKAILTLVRSWPRVHVAFEEGTQAQWLHDVLIDQVERVVVCNVRGKGPLANKDDGIDADRLSEQLRVGALKPVFHGVPEILTLKELVRNYNNLVEDSTRVMLRIKAIFRARGIPTPGVSVYRTSQRKQWLAKLEGGARVRAESLLTQLDALLELRPKAKAAMIVAARRLPGWKVRRSIPFLGPVRVAQLLSIMRTPFRFRTKRNLWPYAGAGGGQAVERESGVRERKAAAKQEAADDARLEPKSQSVAQGGVQGRRQRSGVDPRSAARLLRSLGEPRRGQGAGQSDPGAQDRGGGTASVEERRDLRREETDDASDIALGSDDDRLSAGDPLGCLR